MHYYNIVLVLFGTTVLAAPTKGTTESTTNTSPVKIPAFMTVERCKQMCNTAKAKKALFYGECESDAEEACKGNKPDLAFLTGYSILSDIIAQGNKKGLKVSQEYKAEFKSLQASVSDWNQKATKIAGSAFWPSCSQAIAELAEGEVYVLFPEAVNVLKDGKLDWMLAGAHTKSIWEIHEYPRICENTQVTKLIHVSTKDKDFKEDLTEKLKADRAAGCPEPGHIATTADLPEKVQNAIANLPTETK